MIDREEIISTIECEPERLATTAESFSLSGLDELKMAIGDPLKLKRNLVRLKTLALHPAAAQNLSFPKTSEDFQMLRAMG